MLKLLITEEGLLFEKFFSLKEWNEAANRKVIGALEHHVDLSTDIKATIDSLLHLMSLVIKPGLGYKS